MKIVIFHGHGVNKGDYKRNVFDNREEAELYYAEMLGRGFHVCGGTTDCSDEQRMIVAGIRPEGTLIMLPMELE